MDIEFWAIVILSCATLYLIRAIVWERKIADVWESNYNKLKEVNELQHATNASLIDSCHQLEDLVVRQRKSQEKLIALLGIKQQIDAVNPQD